MPTSSKKFTIALAVPAILIAAYFVWPKKVTENPPLNTQATSAAPVVNAGAPVFAEDAEVVADADGWKTYKNKLCGIGYRAPGDWISQGYLSETEMVLLVTPEAMRLSEEQTKQHPDYVAEGEHGMYDPSVILSVGCYANFQELMIGGGPNETNADYTSSSAFADHFRSNIPIHTSANGATNKIETVKEMVVDGAPAFEISNTSKAAGLPTTINYVILVQKGKIYEINLGNTSYDDLSPTLKQIIASIKLP